MRAGILAVLCCVTACQTYNGTYFDVDGAKAGIAFDQVEFFLGKDAGSATPFTPARPYLATSSQPAIGRQRLLKRLFVDSDVQSTPETTSLRYYLPADEGNLYAHYALVVASRGGVVVGVGEVEKYRVKDDAAYIYDVPLVPVSSGFERWGTPESVADACARWTRMRDGDAVESTYAVSRDGDFDCDGVEAMVDCDDLNYCPPGTSCVTRDTGCIVAGSCDIGSCVDGSADSNTTAAKSCVARTCLPDQFCDPDDDCREDGPVDEFLACAIEIGLSHTEVTMPVKSAGGGLCTHAYQVQPPSNLECLEPRIEWPPSGKIVDWTVDVVAVPSLPLACRFTLAGPTLDAPPLEDAHVVVSVALPNAPGRRTTFVIGFAPYTTAPMDCSQQTEITPPGGGIEAPSCP
jgi:hypothetical protein